MGMPQRRVREAGSDSLNGQLLPSNIGTFLPLHGMPTQQGIWGLMPTQQVQLSFDIMSHFNPLKRTFREMGSESLTRSPLPSEVCHHWKLGRCRRGTACKFSHTLPPDA